MISRSRKRRESQEKEGEMPCTELGGEAPGHVLTTLTPGWEEARRCHSPGGRRDKLGRGPGEEPGPRVRGQESGSSATQQPVVPCPHSTSPPHIHTQTPNPKQPSREKCPLPPVGRAGAKSGLEPGEDVAGKIDVTMVASTTPSAAGWGPASVITALRKEGRPPGSDAPVPGSLFLPLQPLQGQLPLLPPAT